MFAESLSELVAMTVLYGKPCQSLILLSVRSIGDLIFEIENIIYDYYINTLNYKVQHQIAVSNPFVFRHICNLKVIDHFEGVRP